MSSTAPGMIIESFVNNCCRTIYKQGDFDARHTNIFAWCDASVSGSDKNFGATKANVIAVFRDFTKCLDLPLLDEVAGLEDDLRTASSVTALANAIDDWRNPLEQAWHNS